MITFDEWCKTYLSKNPGAICNLLSNAKFVSDQDGDAKIDYESWCKCRFGIKKIIFNYPATIVFWNDGTKTVVKCSRDDKFNKFQGVAAAVMRRMYENLYGSMNYIKKKIAEAQDDSPKLENDVKNLVENTEKKEKNEEESAKVILQVKKIQFDSEHAADVKLTWLRTLIKNDGFATLEDYYRIACHGDLIEKSDHLIGWYDLENANITRDLNTMMYQIVFPEPVLLT